ncbi:MAG: hypothetical protein MJZ37_00060 [Bacilli bacterium]|nr:hypothetical protein [Bacilli bacterium]
MNIYAINKTPSFEERRAIAVLLKAKGVGLGNCSRRLTRKVTRAVILLSSNGYLVDIQ